VQLARCDAAGGPPPVDGSGAAKLWVVSRTLRLRHARAELFAAYTPVAASGPAAEHVVAFDRGGALTVATRLPIGLERGGGWRDTVLELDGSWTDALSGRRSEGGVDVASLFADLPVALLVR
jgi:(1->4)-alpha-D-glucan 1-alpha-D-glucosylmutase